MRQSYKHLICFDSPLVDRAEESFYWGFAALLNHEIVDMCWQYTTIAGIRESTAS